MGIDLAHLNFKLSLDLDECMDLKACSYAGGLFIVFQCVPAPKQLSASSTSFNISMQTLFSVRPMPENWHCSYELENNPISNQIKPGAPQTQIQHNQNQQACVMDWNY